MPRVAYSYQRFSSPVQADGDSIRRQTAAARAWCERHDAQLDTSTTYQDRGRSAFHGKHRQGGVLGVFLSEVEAGRIPRGSVLIVENLDRLSRENPWDAVPLLCSIVNAGLTVVTLSPSEMVYQRGKDLTPLVLAVVEFARGHSESSTKSDRMAAVWGEKKRLAREENGIITRRLPAWVRERGGRLVLAPGPARIVQHVFELAVKGYGLSLIVKKLTVEGVAPFGRAKLWSKAYVHKLLTGRAVLGEHQPLKDRKPDGDPIKGYYPTLVDEATWERAQAALAQRKDRPGRVGAKVASLFTGLLWEAQTQSRMLIAWQTRGLKGKRVRCRVLVSADSMEGRSASVSFPYPVFEEAVLSLLREVRAADVVGDEPEGEATTLAAERAALEQRMRQIEDELAGAGGDVPALARVLRRLDEQHEELLARLAVARQRESNPRSAAWAEAQTLLAAAQDEATRLRLRHLLRQLVQEAWVLVVPRRSHRLAALQVFFGEGARRDFLIHYWSSGRGRQGGWEARSVRWEAEDRGKGGDLDLRIRGDTEALSKFLANVNLSPPDADRPCPRRRRKGK
jgi:DNA invertase Pin-like site-specific DNA recombinase